jgi:hypothetical protein
LRTVVDSVVKSAAEGCVDRAWPAGDSAGLCAGVCAGVCTGAPQHEHRGDAHEQRVIGCLGLQDLSPSPVLGEPIRFLI